MLRWLYILVNTLYKVRLSTCNFKFTASWELNKRVDNRKPQKRLNKEDNEKKRRSSFRAALLNFQSTLFNVHIKMCDREFFSMGVQARPPRWVNVPLA
jgi:hypothetical protein